MNNDSLCVAVSTAYRNLRNSNPQESVHALAYVPGRVGQSEIAIDCHQDFYRFNGEAVQVILPIADPQDFAMQASKTFGGDTLGGMHGVLAGFKIPASRADDFVAYLQANRLPYRGD